MVSPKARIAFNVARQSSLARNPVTSLVPEAIPDSISDRCEMDLSPGTIILPDTRSAGRAAKLRIRLSGASEHGSGIGTEDFEQRRAFLQRAERLRDLRVANVALEIDEEYVVPLPLVRRPRLDTRHVHPVLRQGFQQPEQRTGIVGVARRHQKRGPIGSARAEQLAAQ